MRLHPTPWLLAYLASGLFTLVLAGVALTRGRGPLRRRVVTMLIGIAALLLTNGLVFAAADEATAVRCARLAQATAAWLPLFGLLLAVRLGHRRLSLLMFLAALVTPTLSALSLLTPWMMVGARIYRYGFAGVPGPLYPAVLTQMLFINVVPLVIWEAWSRETRTAERRQLGQVLAATAIGMGSFVDVLPVVGWNVPPLGFIPLSLAAFGLTRAVVAQRALDLRLALRRGLWWLVSSAGGVLVACLFGLPLLRLSAEHPLTLGLSAAALLLAMRLWLATGQAGLDRLIGRRRHDLDAEMATLNDTLAALQTTEELGRAIDRFLGALDRRLAALVVIEPTGRPRMASSAWGAVPAPSRQSPLFAELRLATAGDDRAGDEVSVLLSRDEARGGVRVECERACVRWGAEYLGALVEGDQLLGVLAISPKPGGVSADGLEREALERMCVTVTAALASARLYERLRELHHELEEKAEARQVSLAKALRDLRGAEQRLVQSEKLAALGQIVAGVAADLVDQVRQVHADVAEVRAQASMVATAVADEVARDPALSDDEAVREMARDLLPLLDAVNEGGRRALTIAQDLSGFAPSAAADAPAVARAPARLDELCDSTLMLCAGHLRQINVVRHYDRTLPTVAAEAGPLGQVVLNLILNATQAMKSTGTLTLSIRGCDLDGVPGAELAVGDTGPGIAPEILPHIFEPFFSTKGQTIGTGLGLSVSYGIVERHGGRIHVESALGIGTTFRVQLPLP